MCDARARPDAARGDADRPGRRNVGRSRRDDVVSSRSGTFWSSAGETPVVNDDGLGPAFAKTALIDVRDIPDVTVETDYQLQVEAPHDVAASRARDLRRRRPHRARARSWMRASEPSSTVRPSFSDPQRRAPEIGRWRWRATSSARSRKPGCSASEATSSKTSAKGSRSGRAQNLSRRRCEHVTGRR